ncbi:MAG: NUDIX hydrolase [Candidatus Marsarchaeota archaeon]|nr:NUDIX hydrolase [Candidatus Marsarchaeota archaeon]
MAVVFKGWVIKVETVRNRINGYEELKITKPDVAVIIPMLDKRTMLFERHYRSAIGRYILELPAGHIDAGETPVRAARRELLEETGYRAGRMKPVYNAYMAPGLLADKMHFFAATELRKAGLPTDSNEKMKLIRLSVEKAYKYVKNGRIKDGKSMIGVLHCIAEAKH